MSFAFRRHGYNLDEFERCEEHGCVVMQVTAQAQPRCLVDWLTERAGRRRVVDVIPRERSRRFVPQEEYNAAGLVLEGGVLLRLHLDILLYLLEDEEIRKYEP